MPNLKSNSIGNLGESAVCQFLQKHGYTILSRNYRIVGGEIDIIASSESIIAFVEVKSRKPSSISTAFDSITHRKKSLIIKTAAHYLYHFPSKLQPRFDVAEVIIHNGKILKLNYICNAFDATDFDFIL